MEGAGENLAGELRFCWRAGEGKGEEGDDRWGRSVSLSEVCARLRETRLTCGAVLSARRSER